MLHCLLASCCSLSRNCNSNRAQDALTRAATIMYRQPSADCNRECKARTPAVAALMQTPSQHTSTTDSAPAAAAAAESTVASLKGAPAGGAVSPSRSTRRRSTSTCESSPVVGTLHSTVSNHDPAPADDGPVVEGRCATTITRTGVRVAAAAASGSRGEHAGPAKSRRVPSTSADHNASPAAREASWIRRLLSSAHIMLCLTAWKKLVRAEPMRHAP